MKYVENIETDPENQKVVARFIQHKQKHSDMYLQALSGLQPSEETEQTQESQSTEKPKQAAQKVKEG